MDRKIVNPLCIWKNVMEFAAILRDGVNWVLGNGASILFWVDMWLTARPLTENLLHPNSSLNLTTTLREL